MTLEVGDVIATGTPAKLPEASEQKCFLQPGDVVEITIDKLGTLRNPVTSITKPG
jgi:acylpyruvate hydrolase